MLVRYYPLNSHFLIFRVSQTLCSEVIQSIVFFYVGPPLPDFYVSIIPSSGCNKINILSTSYLSATSCLYVLLYFVFFNHAHKIKWVYLVSRSASPNQRRKSLGDRSMVETLTCSGKWLLAR